MAKGKAQARTIREEALVARRIDEGIKKNPRLEEMWEGLKYWISRNPARGRRVPGTDYFVYVTKSWAPGGVPSIWVYYKVDDNYVYIEGSKIDW